MKRKINEINEAYDTLSDNKKREDYDKNLKKIQIDKSFQFTDDEFEDKDLFNSKDRKKILVNLIELDGIGEIQIESINNFFSINTNTEIVKQLINQLKIKSFKVQNKKGKFSNKTIMFTGGFEKMSRSEAKTLVENNGGKVLGTISKKLDILVIGSSKPTRKKIENAKSLNIKIILEKDWNKILNS